MLSTISRAGDRKSCRTWKRLEQDAYILLGTHDYDQRHNETRKHNYLRQDG